MDWPGVDWAVVNAGGHGFYRVRYGPDLLARLAGDPARLAPIERFNLRVGRLRPDPGRPRARRPRIWI